MCGILAAFSANPERISAIVAREPRLSLLLRARGPDSSGIHREERAYLAHTRLAVLDLSARSHQPMQTDGGALSITYNGEIFNFLELRAELEREGGARFQSTSDTEVVLQAYKLWGPACLERFEGQFAFAIWDRARATAFIARDRLGIKPLYFYSDREVLVVSSELRVVVAATGRATLDEGRQLEFLVYGFVDNPNTILRDVHKLDPGSFLSFSASDARLVARRYWDIPIGRHRSLSESELDRERSAIDADLARATVSQTQSDVPLGLFLSGGIDSTCILAELAENAREVKGAFSVDYEASGGELSYARAAAEHFGVRLYEDHLAAQAISDELVSIVHQLDEPLSDFSAPLFFFLSRMTKPKATVVLSGEGSDELFAGYHWSLMYRFLEAVRAPDDHDPALRPLVERFRASCGRPNGSELVDAWEAFFVLEIALPGSGLPALLTPDARSSLGPLVRGLYRRHFEAAGPCDDLMNVFLYFKMKTWLGANLLVRCDKMTMAHSIELRVPYLDHRLVERVFALPSVAKVSASETKLLLRRIFADRIPRSILHRPKQSPHQPLLAWLDSSAHLARKILLDGSTEELLRAVVAPDQLHALVTDPESLRAQHELVWKLVVLALSASQLRGLAH